MLNQTTTPQSFFLAKERDKLWFQKAATFIESAKMHKITFETPLLVSTFISLQQIFLERNPCFWQNWLWGLQKSINKFTNRKLQNCLYYLLTNYASFQCVSESSNLCDPPKIFHAKKS